MSASYFSTPEEAEDAFYRAFEAGDLDGMMAVWAEDDSVVCIHPGAPRLEGREAIADGWRQLFEHSAGVRFVITDERYTQDALLAIHIVREELRLDGEVANVILATNVYQLIENNWRMILHHASAEPLDGEDEGEMMSVVLH